MFALVNRSSRTLFNQECFIVDRRRDDPQVIERIIDMAKVLAGLHFVEHPLAKQKNMWRKLISGQRKKAIMACFRMAPLYSMPPHRAVNLFLKAYKRKWLDDPENTCDIVTLVKDLCPEYDDSSAEPTAANAATGSATDGGGEVSASTASDAEAAAAAMALVELHAAAAAGSGEPRPDPLRQLIDTFNRAATSEQQQSTGSGLQLTDDKLYMAYVDIMSKSCEIEEDEDDEEGGGGEEVFNKALDKPQKLSRSETNRPKQKADF